MQELDQIALALGVARHFLVPWSVEPKASATGFARTCLGLAGDPPVGKFRPVTDGAPDGGLGLEKAEIAIAERGDAISVGQIQVEGLRPPPRRHVAAGDAGFCQGTYVDGPLLARFFCWVLIRSLASICPARWCART